MITGNLVLISLSHYLLFVFVAFFRSQASNSIHGRPFPQGKPPVIRSFHNVLDFLFI